MNPNTHLSHTPPTNVSSSYEASHFGKRTRSGSISGRLQSASEYLQDRGLLDHSTKAILKDLIILGDSELQTALDRYENDGDASLLEGMIQSGSLQHRLPPDLDLLGDLDLDFMNMKEDAEVLPGGAIEPLRGSDTRNTAEPSSIRSSEPPSKSSARDANHGPTVTFATYNDDGIGDLEFTGDFMSGPESDYIMQMPAQAITSATGSPSAESYLSEHERRMRSNSLFSALLDLPKPAKQAAQELGPGKQWFDHPDSAKKKKQQGIRINPRGKPPAALEKRSALTESLDLAKPVKPRTYKKREKKPPVEPESEEEVEYVPGSGRPRTWSDPNLNQYIDSNGLMQVERPDGWVGAYSPDSRKVRIDRFLQKRNHRVWSKTIKYDVRKNFADSRLRVKGRFVRKEDELMMRELMSLT
jgi:hypothetical protein